MYWTLGENQEGDQRIGFPINEQKKVSSLGKLFSQKN